MGKRPTVIESFMGNMSSIQREVTDFYAKRRESSHDNGTRTNSSESSKRTKSMLYLTGTSHNTGANMGESQSDTLEILSRLRWTNRDGRITEL